MKLFKVFFCFAIGLLVGCGKNNNIAPVSAPTSTHQEITPKKQVVLNKTKEFSGDDWKLELPNDFQQIETDDFTFAAINSSEIKVILDGVDWSSSLKEFVDIGLAIFESRDMKVQISDTQINNLPAVQLSSEKENVKIIVWAFINNKKGWNFICGGKKSLVEKDDMCNSIANSLKITK